MAEAYIFDAIRTPRGKGKQGGSLSGIPPIDLLATLLKSLQERNDLDTAQVEEVILGCVTPIGEQGANIARIAPLYAGWSEKTPGFTLNRFCASGLEAINLGAMKVCSGWEQLMVAGGVESMSRVKMGSDGGAWFEDPRVAKTLSFIPQGVSADLIATLEGFTRQELDQFAVESHQKAAFAWENGLFASVIPIKDPVSGNVIKKDELIRPETSLESLANLNPSFQAMGESQFDSVALQKYPEINRIEHLHHAGNSSGIVDGSALLLIGSLKKGRELGLKPRAKIHLGTTVGTEPTIMLTGPAPATRKVLQKTGVGLNQVDLFEINEAFASVVLKTIRDLSIDPATVNVNGGSIAMGHPLGATGAVILGTLLEELERRDLQFGVATLCVGAGMGIATLIERI